jgi:hypothetical protein
MIEFEGLIVPNEGRLRIIKKSIKLAKSPGTREFSHFSKNYFNIGALENTFPKLAKSPGLLLNLPAFSNSNFQKKRHKTHTQTDTIYLWNE